MGWGKFSWEGSSGCLQPHVLLRCYTPSSPLPSLPSLCSGISCHWSISLGKGDTTCLQFPGTSSLANYQPLRKPLPVLSRTRPFLLNFSIFQVTLVWYQLLACPLDCPTLSWAPRSQQAAEGIVAKAGTLSCWGHLAWWHVAKGPAVPGQLPRAQQRWIPSLLPSRQECSTAELCCSIRGQCGMRAESWNSQGWLGCRENIPETRIGWDQYCSRIYRR